MGCRKDVSWVSICNKHWGWFGAPSRTDEAVTAEPAALAALAWMAYIRSGAARMERKEAGRQVTGGAHW